MLVCLAASLASTHRKPVASLRMATKTFPDITQVSGETKSPWLGTLV